MKSFHLQKTENGDQQWQPNSEEAVEFFFSNYVFHWYFNAILVHSKCYVFPNFFLLTLDIFESVIDRNEIECGQQGIIGNELCYTQWLFPLFVFNLRIESKLIIKNGSLK